MTCENESNHLAAAWNHWQGGQPIEAGRLVFENLPSDSRPTWAARILKLVLNRSGVQTSRFEQTFYTADHREQWANAHRVFDQLRDSILAILEVHKTKPWTREEKILYGLMSLAELVAKVTYNAAHPPDAFDHDSGWWVAVSLRGFVDLWTDDEFSKAAWLALCFQHY